MAATKLSQWVSSKPSDYMTCYIYDLLNGRKIDFKTIPEGVNETYSAEWNPQEVMGRSAPYLSFNGNPARSVDYSVKLDRNILGSKYLSTINKCRKLVYPNYVSGGIVVPPYVYVRFGGMVKMYAIVENVSVSWDGPIIADSKTDPNTNIYSQAELNFSFLEMRTKGQKIPTGKSLYETNLSY